MSPTDIPPEIKRRAIEQALGGPPDDEGGYATPRVVTIYYLTNWRDLIVPLEWARQYRFVLSGDDDEPEITARIEAALGMARELRPQWAVCARVYPVLRT